MARNWLSGTALAVLLVASPAIAQDQPVCALSGANADGSLAERIGQIDANGDGEITLAEFEACLADNNVAEADRATYLAEFDNLDANADKILLIAELEAPQTADANMGGQPEGRVEVTQQAAEVQVSETAPEVTVEEAAPRIAVDQKAPEVEVSQPQPEVSVQQPEPEVTVEQDEPQVAINQPEPQISVDAPPPQVEVHQADPEVRVEQTEPRVSVEQPDPVVNIEKAEPTVEVETEEPKVVVNQAEPEIIIQKVTEADAGGDVAENAATEATEANTDAMAQADQAATAEADTAAADEAAPAQTAAAESAEPTDAGAATAGVPFDELDGADAYNANGDELGRINQVVMRQGTSDLYVVVAAGGFLGIGQSEIVFPYEDVSIVDDEVVIDTPLTKDTIEDREDYEEELYVEVPDDRVVE
ncbi:PRC-barrel domain-containing protein [Acuticoccus sp. M5D2P5]|uniref:PRC-barrel domain-containing protein n=1 Tax=Acuticoccus kalidii TaxID=2910977 RepID=UPI001F35F89D|nr:PRC-barrel domain-containing protein [Acuticoccus kalidii]MCF3932188.1 PRC-barrel domain-containing protein [Acuticoccus kalidii]